MSLEWWFSKGNYPTMALFQVGWESETSGVALFQAGELDWISIIDPDSFDISDTNRDFRNTHWKAMINSDLFQTRNGF